MKKEQIKETLKPIIKQCIKEVLFEEGILSGIVSEVVKGLGHPSEVIREDSNNTTAESSAQREREMYIQQAKEEHRKEIEAQRKSLNESISSRFGGVDLFEGTTPISKAGSPNTTATPTGALQGVDPSDPGVDIARLGIFGK